MRPVASSWIGSIDGFALDGRMFATEPPQIAPGARRGSVAGPSEPIYLDGFATLPLAPEARDAMMTAWSTPGNAGSPNGAGERAAAIIAEGRANVAELIGAGPAEIIFTSGATEANNLAILGIARAAAAAGSTRKRLLVSAIEHKAVIESAKALENEGFAVAKVPVDGGGRLDLNALQALLREEVLLVSVMLVNNETGTIQPVAAAAALAHDAGALFHTDAAQAAGKIPIDVLDLDVDYLSLSAHKMYGPMGVGALFVAAGSPTPLPLFYGGGQQQAARPGTEPVPLIAGFGAAAKAAKKRLPADTTHARLLGEAFLDELSRRQVRYRLIGDHGHTVPGGVAIELLGLDAAALCSAVARDVSLSVGSACTSGQIQTSHVLEAIGISEYFAQSFVRVFCHRYQDEQEIRRAAAIIADFCSRPSLATGGVHQ